MMLYKNWLQIFFSSEVNQCQSGFNGYDLMVLQPASRGHNFLIDSAGLMLMQFF